MATAGRSLAAWLPERNTPRNPRYAAPKSRQKVGNRRSLRNARFWWGAYPMKFALFLLFTLAAVTGTAALLSIPMQALGDEAVVPVKE
jgi:hypothetical protein